MLTTELRAAIRAEFSDLRPRDLDAAQTIGAGESADAVRVGDHVVRIPHGRLHATDLDREVRLLRLLERRGVAATPREACLLCASDGAPLAMAYRYVDGVPARGVVLRGAARERFAGELGVFLGALHAVPVRQARAAGLPAADYWRSVHLPLIEACRPHLGPRLAAAVDRLVEAFAPMVARAPRTLVHGDISGAHTLLGPGGALTGVIDFGFAAVGDPALDLAGVLNDRSRAFLGRVVAHYPLPIDAEALVRAEVYIALAPLFTLRTAAAEGDLHRLARARRQLARGVRAAVERGGAGPYHRPARTKRGSRVVV